MLYIELMTLSKKSFSALEMQRMLGHKRYEPILVNDAQNRQNND
jgi:hypothetical protein